MSDDYYHNTYTVPPKAAALLPPNTTPYATLIPIPTVPEDTPVCPSSSVFSLEPPASLHEVLEVLQLRAIPPTHFLTSIRKQALDAWESGARSLVGVCGSKPMPFWILTFFSRAQSVNQLRTRWMEGHAWFEGIVETADANVLAEFQDTIDGVRAIFARLGYNVPVGHGLRSSDLLELWSTDLISQQLVDAVAEMLNNALPDGTTAMIATTDLQWALELPDEEWEHYDTSPSFTYLREIGQKLWDGRLTKITWPINLEAIHWAMTALDVQDRLIMFGDSLRWPQPPRLIRQLRRWLTILGVPGPFDVADMPAARQDDGYSCAVVSWNTGERHHFGAPAWTIARKHFIRAQYGLRLCEGNIPPE